jgi:hypothetical protein
MNYIGYVLYSIMNMPLPVQFLILIPAFYIISLSIFYFIRITDIHSYKSEERYYRRSHDPLTRKNIYLRALFVTIMLMIIYLANRYL